jgi:hypothetical protein
MLGAGGRTDKTVVGRCAATNLLVDDQFLESAKTSEDFAKRFTLNDLQKAAVRVARLLLRTGQNSMCSFLEKLMVSQVGTQYQWEFQSSKKATCQKLKLEELNHDGRENQ